MKREWKPGDVAVITIPASSAPGHTVTTKGYADVRAVRNATGGWSALENPDYFWGEGYSFHYRDPRSLVVIDPEDREQVERLADLNERATPDGIVTPTGSTNAMQAALREFANPTPPRPDEPQGLGAVVEDADGVRWIRVGNSAGVADNWRQAGFNGGQSGRWYLYGDITAVRVLSEGVTP